MKFSILITVDGNQLTHAVRVEEGAVPGVAVAHACSTAAVHFCEHAFERMPTVSEVEAAAQTEQPALVE